MIIVFKFPKGKCNLGDTKNLKLRSGEKCERSHAKTKKTVMHSKRDQSQSVALSGHENLPEINLLKAQVPSQKNTRALKMHWLQPGCYGHMIGEIQVVCQTKHYIQHAKKSNFGISPFQSDPLVKSDTS